MPVIDPNQFEVRLTNSPEEIVQAQKLRYRVFVDEFGAEVSGENKSLFIERDKFDSECDHLILIDKARKNLGRKPIIVGTIRLLDSITAKNCLGFYSADEYNLDKILALKQNLLEIGRACVDKNYRGHIALHLLWLGLGEYVLKRRIEVIFGVASFHGTNPILFSSALSLLKYKFSASKKLDFKALAPNSIEMSMVSSKELDQRKAMSQMPSLIKAYIKMGAKVGDGAFVDFKFNTIDIGIIIEVGLMDRRYKQLYDR